MECLDPEGDERFDTVAQSDGMGAIRWDVSPFAQSDGMGPWDLAHATCSLRWDFAHATCR